MSLALGLTIAIGGCLLVGAGLVWMVVWLRRDYSQSEAEFMALLQEECARRSWQFEERNDAYADWFSSLPRVPYVGIPDPLWINPRAAGARNIVTGVYRGRRFIAAQFQVYQVNPAIDGNWWTYVRVHMPAPRPGLVVKKVVGPTNAVNRALGWDHASYGDPEFDRRFEVSADDQRFAADVLHTRMQRFLVDEQRPFRGLVMVGDVIDVVGDQQNEHRDPRQLIPALDLRCDILDLVPDTVWAH
ncbi:hypothetical protein Lesp02_69460 [Lentzea sp. NBRC 105346]|uniref:hypothetical protein n=1 Tax=Lentzea sp. NBRC 105346 TaxID=3032205 RepID=UPI0024A49A03|nr:hypothetical protein [Lentzea sp. NBRC 105346]GLZ34759.1 hypothetical protein Lesp02_69460 [Lentzea sp. NBRC 105346]